MNIKRLLLTAGLALIWASPGLAATNDVSTLLQKGLLEEEANRNLDAAIQSYQAVVTQTDKDHQFAATAVFRLGECYRKQGKTNEATAQYQRILREFSDQTELVKLSRDYAGNVTASEKGAAQNPDGLDNKSVNEAVAIEAARTKIKTAREDEEITRIQALMQDSPDLVSGKGGSMTPLIDAVTMRQLKVATFLLDHQANIELRDANGFTPLLLAAKRGYGDMIDLLLSRGADINAGVQSSGQTVLHLTTLQGSKSLTEQLLARGAKVNAPDASGKTPLYVAAKMGFKAMAELLLAHGADVNIKDNERGMTPLAVAVDAGNQPLVDLLIAHQSDVNSQTKDGTTLLSIAVLHNQLDIAQVLLKHGANVNARLSNDSSSMVDYRNWTALYFAIWNKNNPMVELLLENKADPNAVVDRISRANFGATGNYETSGATPLIMSAAQNQPETAQILLSHKADIKARDANGQTALHWAARYGYEKLAELLLAHGADINARDANGRSPLFLAVNSSKEIVELLLTHQAEVNLKDNRGDTPLDLRTQQITSSRQFPGNNNNNNPTDEISDILRRHGAVTALEQDTLRVTTKGQVEPTVIFRKLAQLHDYRTLFEVIAQAYSSLSAISFPDFANLKIKHLGGTNATDSSTVDLNTLLAAGDCSQDMPLAWGDIVEIPEMDHKVNAQWGGLSEPVRNALSKCLQRHVEIIVKGQTTKVTLNQTFQVLPHASFGTASAAPATDTVQLSSFWLHEVVHGANVLLASSDLTRVKVKRTDPATRKIEESVFNLDKGDPRTALWLRDGDMIEIPEK